MSKNRVTQKQIKEMYSPSEIVAVTRKIKLVHELHHIEDFMNLQEIIDWANDNGVNPINVKIDDGVWDDPATIYFDREVEKTDKERYDEGVRILQQREQKKIDEENKIEQDRKEYECLKKQFGD